MRIDRDGIKKRLEELSREGEKKGMQPELVLGCFYSLKVEDDEYCKGCGYYWKCKDALNSYKLEEDKK